MMIHQKFSVFKFFLSFLVLRNARPEAVTETAELSFIPGCFLGPDNNVLKNPVVLFGEIPDPWRPCYHYVCQPEEGSNGLRYKWIERFSNDKCCQYESLAIEIGQTVNTGRVDDDPCVETEVECHLPLREPKALPKIIISRKQTRCCHFNGKVIPLYQDILYPEKCSIIRCQQVPGSKSFEITVDEVFDSCNCCSYYGKLIPDGDTFLDFNRWTFKCIGGKLYRVEDITLIKEPVIVLDEKVNTTTEKHEPEAPSRNASTFKCEFCLQNNEGYKNISTSMKFVTDLISSNELQSTIFIIDQNDELEKAFFRFLATILPYSTALSGMMMYYGNTMRMKSPFAYYRWENQCLSNGCQIAKNIQEDSTKVNFNEARTISTDAVSNTNFLKVIAANLNHLLNNGRLINCRQILFAERKRRLIVYTVDDESVIGEMLNVFITNFLGINLDLAKDLFVILVVVFDKNRIGHVGEPKSIMKTSGIEVLTWRFGPDMNFLNCYAGCQCPESREILTVPLIKPVFIEDDGNSCFVTTHRSVNNEILFEEDNCIAYRTQQTTTTTSKRPPVEAQPFPKVLIDRLILNN